MGQEQSSPSVTPVGRGGVRALWRAAREFLTLPAIVVFGFALLTAVSVVFDQSHAGWVRSLRQALSTFIGPGSAPNVLSAVATGMVTVTSITFSVLLLAVQQTASSLSPVVFDQFVRRKLNQVYLGFFVGLSMYAYVTLAATQQRTAPILGATMAVVLTVVGLLFLLAVIYSTIDEMRPTRVVERIADHARTARDHEEMFIARTRRRPRRDDPVSATLRSKAAGYVVELDLDTIADVIAEVPNAEIELLVTLGSYVSYGDPLARLRDDNPKDVEALAEHMRSAVRLSPQRDISLDASAAVRQIANIVWTSASSAKQNPEVAQLGLDALRELVVRWSEREPDVEADDELPLVYADEDVDEVLDAIVSCAVAAHEAHQSQTIAAVLRAWYAILDHDHADVVRTVLSDIHDTLSIVADVPSTIVLRSAADHLAGMLESHGHATLAQALCDAAAVPQHDRSMPTAEGDAPRGAEAAVAGRRTVSRHT